MFVDLAHTAFAVHSIDDSLAFYAELGIRESFRLNHDDGSLMLVYLHIAGDRFIELFPGGPEPGEQSSQSFQHICLATDDIQSDVERLRSAGVVIDKQIMEGLDHNLQAWITDPDGNKIELMQLSEASPQRKVAREAAS